MRVLITSMSAIIIIIAALISFTGSELYSVNSRNLNNNANILASSDENSMKLADVIRQRESFADFKKHELLNFYSERISDSRVNLSLKKYSILTLDKNKLISLITSRDENIILKLPVSRTGSLELKLFKAALYSDSYKMSSISKGLKTEQQVNKGIFYRGIINNDEKSIVCLNVYGDYISGFYSDKSGNYEFGQLGASTEQYICYKTSDEINKTPFGCELGDNEEAFVKNITNSIPKGTSSARPMKIYFQTDYQLYLDIGQNTQQLNNYVTTIFNYVATIYQNENLPIQLDRLEYWLSPDPYAGDNTFHLVKQFAAFMQDDYNLDIYNMLTTRLGDNNAIARGIRVLCNPYDPSDSSGRYTCSSIALNVIPPYPGYSNVALAVGHEMGHIIGSRHTHACVWPVFASGGIGSIDTCVITGENSPCYGFGTQPNPIDNGTLMSYCDLGGGNVNASLGFGSLPGDTCRLRYNQAPCLSVGIQNISSEIPEDFKLYQNYPNPFNPTTQIKFDITKASKVKLEIYDIRGRIVETIFDVYLQAGKYNVDWEGKGNSSGAYYYKLSSDGVSKVNKMILLK